MDRTNGFDAVAWYYDRLARIVFGKSICRSQTCFLSTLSSTSNILVLGGGTGWWLKEFLQKKPGCRILYVDASPAMLNLAKKAVGDDKRITFRLGTENSIKEVHEFDAVITFFFLDLFSHEKLRDVIAGIKIALKPNARWLVSDFINTTWWHACILSVMYFFFRISTGLQNKSLPDWTGLLLESNLRVLEHKMFFGNFIKSGLYQTTE